MFILFLESGKNAEALDAAIHAKQWGKAAQIADILEDSNLSKQYYGKIAEHHASIGDFEVKLPRFIQLLCFSLLKL